MIKILLPILAIIIFIAWAKKTGNSQEPQSIATPAIFSIFIELRKALCIGSPTEKTKKYWLPAYQPKNQYYKKVLNGSKGGAGARFFFLGVFPVTKAPNNIHIRSSLDYIIVWDIAREKVVWGFFISLFYLPTFTCNTKARECVPSELWCCTTFFLVEASK